MKRGLAEAELLFQGMSGNEIDDVQITVEMDVTRDLGVDS